MIKRIFSPLASLKLTVLLIVLAMLLVYVGTWAQLDNGPWQVQKKYFHSFVAWVPLGILVPRTTNGGYQIPGGFPMLGGYTIGLLMLINLIAAHMIRFKLRWNRAGIILIHLGVILLLLGEGLTSALAVESQMPIEEGSYASYSQDIRESELAVVDPSASDHDNVVVISDKRLKTGGTINDPRLPFAIRIDAYYPNSGRSKIRPPGVPRATQGEGINMAMVGRESFNGVNESEKADQPSGYVTLTARDVANLGTYLVSVFIDHPQPVQVAGKTYQLELRYKRLYKPYTMHLLKFSHDRYTGTDKAKNFASRVRLVDPSRNFDREILIWMNHPLRYHGETIYQAGFDPRTDKMTILQLVKNPGWLMPYVACIIGGLGLILHFGIKLTDFIRRKTKSLRVVQEPVPLNQPPPSRKNGKQEYVLLPRPLWMRGTFLAPAATLALMLIYFIGAIMRNAPPSSPYDLAAFAKLPVNFEGRTQPMDSLARNSLRIMNGSETVYINKEPQAPIKILADIIAHVQEGDEEHRQTISDDYKLFRVGHAQVLNSLNLDENQRKFSIREIAASGQKFDADFQAAMKQSKIDSKKLDSYQKNILQLGENLTLYQRLQDMGKLFLLPPLKEGEDWKQFSSAVSQRGETSHPAAEAWMNILQAYHEQRPADFNRAVADYQKWLDAQLPSTVSRLGAEGIFNTIEPFMRCIELYLLAFILVLLSWVFWRGPLSRASIWVTGFALVIHTIALIARIYISGRPPVTNLYSSAIFIPWGIVVLGLGLEYFYRNGVGIAAASVAGFLSMLIAQNLAADGDTMKMLQAVLDTNFWLATHVVIVTLGYAATFLAGLLGIFYVIKGVLGTTITKDESKDLGRMIYGVVCFAILFSFVGTVLGGIWADQSWGRFWGWDPKENGAVLIVLWNALVLHARWAGLVRERGLAALAIGGNIVTSWSWFGTNMLGVGLHSYGFMDSALLWLLMFVGTQLALIAVANIPLQHWRSQLLAPGKSAD
jgi:ABC-type transport system involved in cytochrome c biogenesis permease subunit